MDRSASTSEYRGGTQPSKRSPAELDAAVSQIAARQEGLVRRDQLEALGFAQRGIHRRLERGFLHRIHRGVYAVGHASVSDVAEHLACAYAAGEGAAVSGPSAAHLWQLLESSPRPIEISVPAGRAPHGGYRRRTVVLPRDEIATVGLVPVTIVARTTLDCAGTFGRRRTEKLLNEAEYLRLPMHLSFAEVLARYPTRPGAPLLRDILGVRDGPTVTRSELEELFRAFLIDRDLPAPLWNRRFDLDGETIYPDCTWHEARLIAELDGFQAHGTKRRLIGDKRRDRRLAARGWRVIRITWQDLTDAAEELDRDLRALLAPA